MTDGRMLTSLEAFEVVVRRFSAGGVELGEVPEMRVDRPRFVYFAGAFGTRGALRRARKAVEREGVIVCARWLDAERDAMTIEEARVAALECLEDLAQANMVIAFSPGPGVAGRHTGGRHVEVGVALARGLPVIVVGDRENVFHSLPAVRVVADVPALLEALR